MSRLSPSLYPRKRLCTSMPLRYALGDTVADIFTKPLSKAKIVYLNASEICFGWYSMSRWADCETFSLIFCLRQRLRTSVPLRHALGDIIIKPLSKAKVVYLHSSGTCSGWYRMSSLAMRECWCLGSFGETFSHMGHVLTKKSLVLLSQSDWLSRIRLKEPITCILCIKRDRLCPFKGITYPCRNGQVWSSVGAHILELYWH